MLYLFIFEQGYTPQHTATAAGVDVKLTHKWKNKTKTQHKPSSLGEEGRGELQALRKEVKNLRIKKAILKKASTVSLGNDTNTVNI